MREYYEGNFASGQSLLGRRYLTSTTPVGSFASTSLRRVVTS
jgi:hypothetical protein